MTETNKTNKDSEFGGSALNDGLGLPVAAYDASNTVQIVACRQRDGGRLWAVRNSYGSVLANDGLWEFEPNSSSRNAEYLARCRYATPLIAHAAYMLALNAA